MTQPGADPEPLDDTALARSIATASCGPASEAEAELCRRYFRRLVGFGRQRLGSEDAARDLAQDSLMLAIEKLRAGEVREPERIGAFILGVARTLAINRQRDRHRDHVSLADANLPAFEPTLRDPIAHARIAHCLDALPAKHRSVVLMSFYAEQSSEEIGASLGLSQGNVRVLRHRGVAHLRDCLGLGSEASA